MTEAAEIKLGKLAVQVNLAAILLGQSHRV